MPAPLVHHVPPSKVEPTPAIIDQIVLGVRGGLWPETAALCVGVDEPTLKGWLWEGAQGLRCGYVATDARARLTARLTQEIQRALANFEANVLKLIQYHMADPQNWRLATWMLERRFPQRWGTPEQRKKGVLDQMHTGLAAPAADYGRLDDAQVAQLEAIMRTARSDVGALTPATPANGHTNGHANGYANGHAKG